MMFFEEQNIKNISYDIILVYSNSCTGFWLSGIEFEVVSFLKWTILPDMFFI